MKSVIILRHDINCERINVYIHKRSSVHALSHKWKRKYYKVKQASKGRDLLQYQDKTQQENFRLIAFFKLQSNT